MSWFTVGEIVGWLVLAAALGVVLGWLLHEVWNRSRAAARAVAEPHEAGEPEDVSTEQPAEQAPATSGQIKGKKSSMIYHVPGSPAYERTHADEWFASEDEAVAAGYRKPRNR